MILLAFLAQTLRIAIPYLLAAAGGVISERAGLIALTLEGYMLGGAFSAVAASYATGSPWAGVVAAVAGGAVLALVYAVSAVRFRADQVVVGIAINLIGLIFAVGYWTTRLRMSRNGAANSSRSASGDKYWSFIILAASITEPPPSAMIWSALWRRSASTPCRMTLASGSASGIARTRMGVCAGIERRTRST